MKSSRGAVTGLVADTAIVDAQWVNDAVIVTYRNGNKVRYYGPNRREYL